MKRGSTLFVLPSPIFFSSSLYLAAANQQFYDRLSLLGPFKHLSGTQVVSHKVVCQVTPSPSVGNMRCSGSLAFAYQGSCQDSKVTIATSPMMDSGDELVMIPVPKHVRSGAGEVYLVEKTRIKECARFLSAVPGCRHNLVKLAMTDYGTGLQR
jgi:hypothetical protein